MQNQCMTYCKILSVLSKGAQKWSIKLENVMRLVIEIKLEMAIFFVINGYDQDDIGSPCICMYFISCM